MHGPTNLKFKKKKILHVLRWKGESNIALYNNIYSDIVINI